MRTWQFFRAALAIAGVMRRLVVVVDGGDGLVVGGDLSTAL